jgi:hypothetical protein
MEQLDPGLPKKRFFGPSKRFGTCAARTFPRTSETNSRRKMSGRRRSFEPFRSLPLLESLVNSG